MCSLPFVLIQTTDQAHYAKTVNTVGQQENTRQPTSQKYDKNKQFILAEERFNISSVDFWIYEQRQIPTVRQIKLLWEQMVY